ncbi:exodeoxyribonuclease VII large subunit [Arsenicicoccus sp. oral taxon 190]|uniref:exodeoxyribonuclease VII large subunit n=1 Tax=Arsenicicoccus sp. oral taxon 190 TaxID=1658671 RepID=UPI000679EDF3|nr:exodeoxyribonuclease VII large subunit [Arsenicicoccus sp. oral taxon 190]AKT51331.1 exodeoxyribonuclease VII large subunit [Arsenicicoccus sp. oral taxon 190]
MSTLPERANQTTAEHPWPVRLLSMKIADYVDKMSGLWVEGQVVQLNRRPGAGLVFLTLRDPDVDMSLSVTLPTQILDRMPSPLSDGARVVVQAKPTFWTKRGTLQLEGRQVRAVGVGELLARLEHLKRVLAAEGLFAAERKRPLPFLPRRVGLVCGRASQAEHDVVQNALRRWPATEFEIRRVAVQGSGAVAEVSEAVRELDALREVDVIVIARGGGSVEDLLPFSNEALVRVVSDCFTPVVSAIGHHEDTPLLDHVADWRASTPTDAGRRVVPDLAEQQEIVAAALARLERGVRSYVERERRGLATLRSRPVLARPVTLVEQRRAELDRLLDKATHRVAGSVHRDRARVSGLAGRLRALSPLGTLERGYAVVQHRDGSVVTDREDVQPDELLRVRVTDGDFGVRVLG